METTLTQTLPPEPQPPLTALEACKLCQAVYSPIAPGTFDQVGFVGKISFGYKLLGDLHTFSFAGSENPLDWIRDLDCRPLVIPKLGTVHTGFWEGILEATNTIIKILVDSVPAPYRVSFAGHSLGAAHAAYMAGVFARASCKFFPGQRFSIPVETLFLFESPNSCFPDSAATILANCAKVESYANEIDPVPGLPATLGRLMPWQQVTPAIMLEESPGNLLEDFDPFAYHAIALDIQGLEKIGVSGT
jgi:hypothetical protein